MEINDKIKDCISDAHKFSQNLGESRYIKSEYIINKLSDLASTDIHVALLKLHDNNEINYNSDTGLIEIL